MDFNNYPRPIVMVDIAIFTVQADTLKVLLVKRGIEPFRDAWALPGGAVHLEQDQTLADAASRELIEETGVREDYLEQLYTYSGATRDPRGWSISVAYFALVSADKVLRAGTDASEARWHSLRNKRVDMRLAFDHANILQDAIERLRSKLDYSSIAVHLLPEEFTLSEFQHVYEVIMEAKLNKASFRQRVDKAGIVEAIQGKMRTGANRPAQLYRFIQKQEDQVFFPRSIVWAERKQ